MSTELYTVEDCAEKAKCHPKTIKREIDRRRLKGTWVDGRPHVARVDWEAYLDAGGSDREDLEPAIDYSDRIAPALSSQTPIYNGPAVYFLFNEGQLVYIGQAKRLLERLPAHCKDKRFDSFSFVACTANELGRIERWAIRKYRPSMNKR